MNFVIEKKEKEKIFANTFNKTVYDPNSRGYFAIGPIFYGEAVNPDFCFSFPVLFENRTGTYSYYTFF